LVRLENAAIIILIGVENERPIDLYPGINCTPLSVASK
jgi:hypothetical protein